MASTWKAFQDLVGRIERIASRKDAVVRSPDRVPDLVTGTYREVDVSIRQRIGSAEVLITVECRQHSTVQDVTWVEQLAAKRQNIGAALTIAVSASGFSAEAIALAKRQGIAVRTVADLPDEELQEMLSPVVHLDPRIEIVAIGIVLGSSDQHLGPSDLPASLQERMKIEPNNAPIFRHVTRPGRLSLNDIFRLGFDSVGPRVFDGIPHDGTWVTKPVCVETPHGDLFLDSSEFSAPVSRVRMRVKMSVEARQIPAEVAVRYSGAAPSASIKHAEYEVPGDKGAIRLHFQRDESSPSLAIGVQIRGENGVLQSAKLGFVRRYRKDGTLLDPKQHPPDIRIIDL